MAALLDQLSTGAQAVRTNQMIQDFKKEEKQKQKTIKQGLLKSLKKNLMVFHSQMNAAHLISL